MGHVKMMSAVQPFISGAISKTVNVPENTTVEQFAYLYMQAWQLGVLAIALYRENSQKTQPLNVSQGRKEKEAKAEPEFKPVRRKLPRSATQSPTNSASAAMKATLPSGCMMTGSRARFPCDGERGSAISGLMDSFATAISLALQYGVPLKVLIDKFSHVRFEPSGHTGNSEVPYAKSIVDYIFRWLASKFLPIEEQVQAGVHVAEKLKETEPAPAQNAGSTSMNDFRSMYNLDDAPTCAGCGSIMVRNGSCYKCMNCGETSGCS